MHFLVRLVLVTFAACGAYTALAKAQSTGFAYPTKSIRLLVGFNPGGGADTLARLMGPSISESLGQQVVIDNRAGANGVISMELTARAPADGYTVMVLSASSVVSATLLSKVAFDINKSFAPVTLLTNYSYVLLVPQSLPVSGVKDLVAYAKSKPGALNYGSSGQGSAAHLGMELFKQAAGVEMTHIPYKGIGPAITELMGGQIHLLFGSTVSAGAAVATGKVRALAVTSMRRAKALPDLPTIAESGVPSFDLTGWYGLVAPAGVPGSVVTKLNRAAAHVLGLPDVQNRLVRDGSEAAPSTPAQLAATVAKEIRIWEKLMQQSNLKLE